MNKTAIAFSTKDRVDLTRQSIEPLLQPDKFDTFWADGSSTRAGVDFAVNFAGSEGRAGLNRCRTIMNVRGGADAAIVYGLTALLDHPNHYDFVGLVENDVLLDADWFEPTMALFARGEAEGLGVGAVSARCYEDRILCQRDGYAVMHNLGAGMVLFRRDAARLVLDNFRTGWWPDNRAIFAQLSGLDIGRWGAFRFNNQGVTADWHFDTVLASYGLASLALTPSPVQMIGQVPPLHQQGLRLATEPLELLRDDKAFDCFAERTRRIRESTWYPGARSGEWFCHEGLRTIFPHQFAKMGASQSGDWSLKWSQGFGPFAWRAAPSASLTIPVIGACTLLVGGGERGATVELYDAATGQTLTPQLLPDTNNQAMGLVVPEVMCLRDIRLTALSEGATVYGLQTRQPQPWLPHVRFDHKTLPPFASDKSQP